MENHDGHHTEPTWKDYAAFAGVILVIIAATLLWSHWQSLHGLEVMRIFMAMFFLVFSFFKLADIRGFATSYMGYDIIAKKINWYGYAYPFIELALGLAFLFNLNGADWVTLVITIIGAVGVGKELLRKSNIKCACLGTYINLPLSTVSLTEDLLMGAMALIMILK
ncbi:MAG TPA: MauE/DoxX family redox-associated membrane protein [Patescibacteria group bacterium]|jgi:hypothetical protein|nr:MauE/DoxX family redox-associated membrane protein [Patescibacteria group bacterium]